MEHTNNVENNETKVMDPAEIQTQYKAYLDEMVADTFMK